MKTLNESRQRFTEIVDTLTEAVVQSSNLDADLLTRTATSESQNLAELGRELLAMRTPLPNGLGVCAHDFEALIGFVRAKGLRLESIEDGVELDGGSGRVVSFKCNSKKISDPGALAGLTSLKKLDLQRNRIQDISALSGLTLLKELNLCSNRVPDIAALSALTGLEQVDLAYNRIQDISALSGLTRLKSLDLEGNQIQDISALSGLTSLTALWMDMPKDQARAAAIKFDDQVAALRDRGVQVALRGVAFSLKCW